MHYLDFAKAWKCANDEVELCISFTNYVIP